jgi:hypothetical protein
VRGRKEVPNVAEFVQNGARYEHCEPLPQLQYSENTVWSNSQLAGIPMTPLLENPKLSTLKVIKSDLISGTISKIQ